MWEDFGDQYISDGSGVSYETTVNIQAFDAEASLDDDDFEEICIEIEHSYLGDLQLELNHQMDQQLYFMLMAVEVLVLG